jgi:hypothetical protein
VATNPGHVFLCPSTEAIHSVVSELGLMHAGSSYFFSGRIDEHMGAIQKAATWAPTILLGVMIVFAVSQGLGIESLVIVALLLIQAVFLAAPHLSRWIGQQIS